MRTLIIKWKHGMFCIQVCVLQFFLFRNSEQVVFTVWFKLRTIREYCSGCNMSLKQRTAFFLIAFRFVISISQFAIFVQNRNIRVATIRFLGYILRSGSSFCVPDSFGYESNLSVRILLPITLYGVPTKFLLSVHRL